MSKLKIMQLVMELMIAYEDDKITMAEANSIAMSFLGAKGIDVTGTWMDVFVELDGDVHIILRKDLIDKIGVVM